MAPVVVAGVEVPATEPPYAPVDIAALWAPVRERMLKRLLGLHTNNVAKGQATTADRCLAWVVEQKLPPSAVTKEILEELVTKYSETLDDVRPGRPGSKNPSIYFYRIRAAGRRLLEEPLLDEPPEPVIRKSPGRPLKKKEPEPKSEPEPESNTEEATMRRNDEEPELIEDGSEGEGEEEGEVEEVSPEEVRPSKRPRRQAVQQPVFVMQQAVQPRRGPVQSRQAPPRSKLIQTPEKIRLYKRGMGGKRILVNEYTTDDIGNMSLHVFIKDYVDPEFGDPSGLTTYEAVGVSPINDRDTGSASTVTIESTPQPDQMNSPVTHVRDAIGLIHELEEMNQVKNSKQSELLAAAQAKAVGSGDLGQLMMLMMMEKLNKPHGGDSDGVMKIVELLQRQQQSAPPMQSLANLPPPTPYMMPPMAPPAPSPLEKVMEVLLTKMLQPPPPQPTFLEQMVQYQQMQQLMGGGGSGAIAQQLAALSHKLDQPRESGGIEASLTMFEKLSTAVKTLAPQLNMGGLTGAIQTILTPELGKAIGGMVAQGIEQKQQQGKPVLPATGVPQKPAVDPMIVQKVQVLRIAQTPPVQIAATIDLVQAMWQGAFKAQLEPALSALMTGNVDPARQALGAVLTDARPELATREFIDDVLRAMAAQTGMETPAALKPQVAPPVVEPAVEAVPAPAPVPVVAFEKPGPLVGPEPVPEEPYVEHAPMVPKPKLAAAPEPELLQVPEEEKAPVPVFA